VVAHIDHGKSTLSDRLLEASGAIPRGGRSQYLDRLEVERERGITVKAQTASFVHRVPGGEEYLLNLIDTPGHVDFSYEVSRSLAACQGALLLVDAAQGVQAQTAANFFLCFEGGLEVVPVLNKIDVAAADPDAVAREIEEAFDLPASEALRVSAKTGVGLPTLLEAVVTRVPPPAGDAGAPLRALLFDAHLDPFRGVVCLLRVVDGELQRGDRLQSAATGETFEALEVGLLTPEATPTPRLQCGQVGYVITGMKHTSRARVGDTWRRAGPGAEDLEPLPGFSPAKSVCFGGLFPVDSSDYEGLADAVQRLALNDPSVEVHKEVSQALGSGFRIGYLGPLHMEVFQQRLQDEHGEAVVATAPFVPVAVESSKRGREDILSPAAFPHNTRGLTVLEPIMLATLMCPEDKVGGIIALCHERRGEQVEHRALPGARTLMRFELPAAELARDFIDQVKSRSSGYASFDYETHGERPADLVRLDILVNGESVDALARVVHKNEARTAGKRMVERLKDVMVRQQFEVQLQAAVGSKIIARETIKSFRKNVLAKCYGGDVTRKRKLLEKQKEGKKRMRRIGKIDVPSDALHRVLADR